MCASRVARAHFRILMFLDLHSYRNLTEFGVPLRNWTPLLRISFSPIVIG